MNYKEFFISIFLVLFIAFGVLVFNGKDIKFLRKFTAVYSTFDFTQVRDHEILQDNHIGSNKDKIVLLGSCMLGTIHCVMDQRPNDTFQECAISDLLEQKLIKNSNSNWRVANLSITSFTLGHSLNVFLQKLNDPKFKVFIWENDFQPSDSVLSLIDRDLLTFLPYLLVELRKLKLTNPDIGEINELIQDIENKFPNLVIPKDEFLNHWNSQNKSVLAGSISNLSQSLKMIGRLQFRDLARELNSNTSYLRLIQANMYRLLGISLPDDYYNKFIQKIKLSNVPYSPHFYKEDDYKNKNFNQDKQILVLRIMGKLAKKYNKKIYIFWGPSTACEKDEFITRNFVEPITKGLIEIPGISYINLKNLKMDQKIDSFNCINYTLLGKMKISDKIYENLVRNGDI